MSGEAVKGSKARKRPAGRGFGASEAVQAAAKWRDGYNPLWALTVERAVWLCQNYSRGRFSELMWLFGAPFMGIEASDPVYGSIIKRRTAALRRMDWSIRVGEAFDGDERAEAQRAALQAAYDRIENLYEGIAALEMATFRGFAHLEIGERRLTPIQPWNVARDGSRGGWRYNPEARDTGFEELGPEMDMDPACYVTREVEIPVGRYALVKFLRQSLSDRDWDAFIEIYGLPAWLIVGPPDIPQDKVQAFESAAEKIARGGSGYLPNGSSAQCADSPRGTSPFEARLRYLNEMLVIAGTGGKLTMLAEAGSGTLAGSAHQDAFESLAQDDAQDISECFQRQFDAPVLRSAGLLEEGERPRAWFTLDFKEESDVGEVCGQIAQLAAAGYEVDPGQIQELTGYKVSRLKSSEVERLKGSPFGKLNGSEGEKVKGSALSNSSTVQPFNSRDAAEAAFAGALQRDLKPAGKVIAEALQTRDWSEAKKRLAGILKECGTESAKVLEGAMREAGEAAAEPPEGQKSKVEGRRSGEAGEVLANERARGETTEGTNSGSFAPEGGGVESEKARKKREKQERQDAAAKAGAARMADVKAGKDCPDFMPGVHNSNVTADHIAFYQGDETQGYLHIANHAPDLDGNYNHQAMLEGDKIPRTVAKGTWYKHDDKIVAVDGNRCVAMVPDGKGLRIHTAYESNTRAAQIRNGGFKRLYNRKMLEDAQ